MMEPYFDTLESTARDTIILWIEYVNCIDFWLEENVKITMLWKFWMQCFVRVEIDIEHELLDIIPTIVLWHDWMVNQIFTIISEPLVRMIWDVWIIFLTPQWYDEWENLSNFALTIDKAKCYVLTINA